MNEPNKIHREAMKYAQDALVAEMNNEEKKSFRLYEKAYKLERQVALLYLDKDIEPTRSVLFKSAASLAKTVKKYDDAIFLIEKGLTGNPPYEIEAELQKLYNQVSREVNIQLINELKSIKSEMKQELSSIHKLLKYLVSKDQKSNILYDHD